MWRSWPHWPSGRHRHSRPAGQVDRLVCPAVDCYGAVRSIAPAAVVVSVPHDASRCGNVRRPCLARWRTSSGAECVPPYGGLHLYLERATEGERGFHDAGFPIADSAVHPIASAFHRGDYGFSRLRRAFHRNRDRNRFINAPFPAICHFRGRRDARLYLACHRSVRPGF